MRCSIFLVCQKLPGCKSCHCSDRCYSHITTRAVRTAFHDVRTESARILEIWPTKQLARMDTWRTIPVALRSSLPPSLLARLYIEQHLGTHDEALSLKQTGRQNMCTSSTKTSVAESIKIDIQTSTPPLTLLSLFSTNSCRMCPCPCPYPVLLDAEYETSVRVYALLTHTNFTEKTPSPPSPTIPIITHLHVARYPCKLHVMFQLSRRLTPMSVGQEDSWTNNPWTRQNWKTVFLCDLWQTFEQSSKKLGKLNNLTRYRCWLVDRFSDTFEQDSGQFETRSRNNSS